jgi:putative SOS response-associated peptidase YedK
MDRSLATAGIWREGKDDAPPAFTKLTTEPGQDIGLYHDRQVVILQPRDCANWIYLTKIVRAPNVNSHRGSPARMSPSNFRWLRG